MNVTALIEKSPDGTYGIYTPDIDTTIIGSGETVAEAKQDFENSVAEIMASYDGEELPDELKGITFEYKFDLASLFNYFDWINISKVAARIGINPSLMRQYAAGNTYISEKQAAKIERGLHELGAELTNISLICS